MRKELNEQDIKAAVLEKIRDRLTVQDAVLVNEMVFGSGNRRADLVLVNGHIQAFEVKSDFDTLRRLSGQLNDYLSRFDKLTLVVSSRYVRQALESDERVGVWEALSVKDKVVIRVRRVGRIQSISNPDAVCDFMLKSELVNFLRSRRVLVDYKVADRERLIELCALAPVSSIRKEAIACVKARYSELSSSFLSQCSDVVVLGDLERLSRSKAKRRQLEKELDWNKPRPSSGRPREINLSRFFPDGDIPDTIPRHVLVPVL